MKKTIYTIIITLFNSNSRKKKTIITKGGFTYELSGCSI